MSPSKKLKYRWQKGDLIKTSEAAELLGVSKSMFSGLSIHRLEEYFREVGVNLTTDIWVGRQRRFLRSEIDRYISRVVDRAQQRQEYYRKATGIDSDRWR